MDYRFEFAGVGTVGWAGYGSRCWSVSLNRHHSRFSWLDGKSPISGIHCIVQSVRCARSTLFVADSILKLVGNERGFLAGTESHCDCLCLGQ